MTDALVLRNLTKTYKSGLQALKGIDLTVAQGDFYALLGPNGAGKSTTISIISSLTLKTSGSVEIFGYDLDKEASKAKQCIGVVPQEFNFGMFEKVFDILVTQAGYYGIPRPLAMQRAEKYLTQLGLWEKRNVQARLLSGGMKRRLMIARAMVHEPRMLILDEPTAGVDIELRRSMWDFLTTLNEQGTSIILTTHYLEEAEVLCKRIAIIDKGEIKKDTDMKSLLASLSVETFILDLRSPLETLPQINLAGITLEQIDANTLELSLEKNHSLNDVFDVLTAQGITISSMRNKSNRLEELFVGLVEKNLKG
ncbi:ABC transporter ATP-binding protein [Aquirhabdus parva]|uniref:ABC transporter ATP-binding protein n=1 Tax=Aquirhabdus parva TaxID=2283318 RepID=A0A345P711_9GAMM|nr:ABC transporter ATP-binding protein [Aquirhabdus parva]AXI03070.1 ABC transporter ATP-binding protein [Aquirhabdus parva]